MIKIKLENACKQWIPKNYQRNLTYWSPQWSKDIHVDKWWGKLRVSTESVAAWSLVWRELRSDSHFHSAEWQFSLGSDNGDCLFACLLSSGEWCVAKIYDKATESVICVGLKVLIAVTVKSSIYWNTTSQNPMKFSRCFGGTRRFHF